MERTDEITIHYQYTVADAVHASRLYRATTAMRPIGKALGVLFLALGCVSFYFWGLAWYTVACFVLAIVVGLDLLTPLQGWLSFRANVGLSTQPWEVTFDGEGVHARTGTVDIQRAWAAYTGAVESESLILLVYGKWLFATLPKRAFSDEEEIQVFRRLLESKGIPYRRIGMKGWLL